MLTFTTLASGSSGNAALMSCGDTYLLLDAGISARRITTALKGMGVDPGCLSAILVTHEHSDHISGLATLTKQLGLPVYATAPTLDQLCRKVPLLAQQRLCRAFRPGDGFPIGEIWVQPFATDHDAAGSVGYSLTGDGCKLTLCTDLGRVTPQVEQAVSGCDLLVCETNYDPEWLASGPYPYYLKRRIMGDRGHLSNEMGALLALRAAQSGTRHILLAHLSAENNTPARALETVRRTLAAGGFCPGEDLTLAVAPRSEAGTPVCLDRTVRAGFSLREAALC